MNEGQGVLIRFIYLVEPLARTFQSVTVTTITFRHPSRRKGAVVAVLVVVLVLIFTCVKCKLL